jgi:hypothetical protein
MHTHDIVRFVQIKLGKEARESATWQSGWREGLVGFSKEFDGPWWKSIVARTRDGPVRRYEGLWVDVCGGVWFCGAFVVLSLSTWPILSFYGACLLVLVSQRT